MKSALLAAVLGLRLVDPCETCTLHCLSVSVELAPPTGWTMCVRENCLPDCEHHVRIERLP